MFIWVFPEIDEKVLKIKLVKHLFSALVVSSTIMAIQAQEEEPKLINQKSAGILFEYGSPYYYLPEGQRYYVLTTGATFSFPLFQAKKAFNMSLDLFPHYAFVWVDDDNSNYEFGLNVRLGFNLAPSPNDLVSFKLGSGPHYITVETEKQANGFLFSDYFLLAYDRRLYFGKQAFALELEFGYRHISNAGFQQPNRSISNFIFGLGFSVVF
jgi:hypothetical protein